MDSVSQLLTHLEEVRQARSKDHVRVLDAVEENRRRRQRASVRLLQDLTPHLHAARAVDRELNRHLAHRFNVFRYLRDDELGLSRIIADLLDPDGDHGQGGTYLEAMLELLEVPHTPSDAGRIRVVTERGMGGRFIDITVDFPTDSGLFCLAFENKPYAGDQHKQCIDYLESLGREYDGRFLLVYLPPRFRMPDDASLPRTDYRECWTNHFRVLPYAADDAPLASDGPSDEEGAEFVEGESGEAEAPAQGNAPADDDAHALAHALAEDEPPDADDATDDNDQPTTSREASTAYADAIVGNGASLADWFGNCRKLSDAERLRWFLRDAQLYCRGQFGDSTMTDTEVRYVREYLDENPRLLHAAFAVARAWPAARDDVCRRFLDLLRDKVEERAGQVMPRTREDLRVVTRYGGHRKWSNELKLMNRIILVSVEPGPNGWSWGVCNPKPETLRKKLVELLKRRGLSFQKQGAEWPLYEHLPRYGHWDHRVPELVQELADGGGKITDYYVNGLLAIAEKAIPAFDEVEEP